MDINKMTKEQIEYRIRQIDGREMFLISADYMTDEQKEEVKNITLEREQLQKRLEELNGCKS
ncbi:hypothetical protein [Eubacterium sp.]